MAEVSPIIEMKVRFPLLMTKTHTHTHSLSLCVSFVQVVSIYTVHHNLNPQRM